MLKENFMKVSDIMTRDVIMVKKETSLKEAAGLLAKFRIHSLPVVDDNKKVLGIVAESDFFTKDSSNIFLPSFLDFINSTEFNSSDKAHSVETEKKIKIMDIMTSECFTVQPDLPVEQLIQFVKEKNFNSIPVVDDQGIIVGIVSIMDIIRLL